MRYLDPKADLTFKKVFGEIFGRDADALVIRIYAACVV